MHSHDFDTSRRQTPTQDTPIEQDILHNRDRSLDEAQAPPGERPSDFAPASIKANRWDGWIPIVMAGLLVLLGLGAFAYLRTITAGLGTQPTNSSPPNPVPESAPNTP